MSTIKDFLPITLAPLGDAINDVFTLVDNPDVNLPDTIPQRFYMPPCEYLTPGAREIYLVDQDVPPTTSLFTPDGYALPYVDTESILVCSFSPDGPMMVLGAASTFETTPETRGQGTLSGFLLPIAYKGINVAGIVSLAAEKICSRAAVHTVLRQKSEALAKAA